LLVIVNIKEMVIKVRCILFIGFIFIATSVLAIDCPTCPYHYCPTDIVTLIEQNITVSVPGTLPIAPFTQVNTIQEALSALDNYKIASGVTVTIQLTQNVENYDTINITHPDGDKVRIVGNCSGGACTIQFKPGINGVYVANGNKLGFLDNFKLLGQQSDQTVGIYAYEGGNIVCGINMAVQKFCYGVWASRKSYIHASNVVTQYNSMTGIYAYMGSFILADNAMIDHNYYGIIIEKNSHISASNAVVSYNNFYAIEVNYGSSLDASNLNINLNGGCGIHVGGNSSAKLDRPTIADNIYCGSSTQESSATTIYNGVVQNNSGCGFCVDLGGVVFALNTIITGNKPDIAEATGGHVYQ
jgi:hypothetical protein